MPMIWTAPRTWMTGEIVAAAMMNTHVRDNLDFLKGQVDAPLNAAYAGSPAIPSTTSGSFADVHANYVITLTTTGAPLLLGFSGTWKSASSGADCCLDVSIDGTRIGHSSYGLTYMQAPTADQALPFSHLRVISLAAGSHTFRLQWRVSTGTLSLNHSLTTQFYVIEL